MGTLTPQQIGMLTNGLLILQKQVKALGTEVDQLLTVIASIPPPPQVP